VKRLIALVIILILAAPVWAQKPAGPPAVPSADMRIIIGVHLHESMPMVAKKYIDASSKPVGDYVKEYTVERGPTMRAAMKLYVTAAGLALIEKYKGEDKQGAPEVSCAVDGTPLSDWWNGIVEEGKGNLR